MPPRYQHILSDGTEDLYPLFVVFSETPERIKRGLRGAYLPYVVQTLNSASDEMPESLSTESLRTED
jgi:hypothetical protein